MTGQEKRFIGLHLVVAIFALAVGSLFGPLQAFEWSGLDLYQYLEPIGLDDYYKGLTAHGVLNALVWTTFFITGFLTLTTIVGLRRPLRYPKLNQVGFWMMVVGLVMAAVPILAGWASVLYTFYPPLEASWAFYLGLTLVVVGSWIEGYGFFFTYIAWRKENQDVRTPFIAFGGLITMAMWQIATLGIAVEILTMLLPYSLGLTSGTDPELGRTFFWFTGHPLVYFWLLPAYISWYGMLPKQAGGKLFSDSLARLAFWLFLLLSIPVGFHHQFVDPGIPSGWKAIHAALTYGVAFPSMLTLFTVVASLEYAASRRGGKGLFGWIRALPWNDPSVSAQLLAGILFMFGGIGGITNASYDVNLVVHNTAWIPGHFHLTVATAVTLSFMGISYWLVPHLTGKPLWKPKWALVQTWLWFVGMVIFSNAMHVLGLLGAPRRTELGTAPYVPDEWNGHLLRVSIGGAILLVSVIMYVVTMVRTAAQKERVAVGEEVQIPIAESLRDPQLTPLWLDTWRPWIIGTVLLIVLAYGPQLYDQITNASFSSPGFGP
ncbi:MAG: b(o/a)3-type cytochrome-c oxidase subunit 1 [Acidimicrobiia bacterium]|nr:b(o/a)3-type cytochrome-c oxidase subunit 1 [Acidimicrobiia bacterium]MBT8193062.1 b(o/a)3-type cytochrome-c oxidase subunit 1 [Acidimicrobiia bacterium]MBT8246461.1 b(o/a)3-type cytochrome-c oxidase subunit 1 [Acidimicrobiia bacterium]NNF87307.1 b(o/a)3-type cytochrome-c oxidase subunit 1 [Acidimicrobiia bacterium]NNL13836.1 b(o/a)3-type cytochrome-c oxidase subunit 1 [Acidimicrobiia bacterium]